MENNTYKVLEIEKFGGEVKVGTRQFRDLKKGEALVKIMSTNIHLYDLMFLNGIDHVVDPVNFPFIPGNEGSGIIVKVGEGVDEKLVGKRVTVERTNSTTPFEGVWGQYAYVTAEKLMVYNTDVDYDKIGFGYINPVTAIGFLHTAKDANTKAIVQDAASSSLAKMVIQLCKKEGIKTINIVRNEEYIKSLTDLGADHVISTSNRNWETELKKVSHELEAKLFFDVIGGELPAKILSCLPAGSTLYNCGNLTRTPISSISSLDLIFQKKTLKGWGLTFWLLSRTPEQIKEVIDTVVKSLDSGSNLFETKIAGSYPLEEINQALKDYVSNLSAGKVVLRPNGN